MKAEQFLKQCADVLIERGKEYDKPEGERSMGKTVAAFESITGKTLTEAEGWLFMQVLKDVRQWQNPSRFHEDSAVDCVSYSALKAEALSAATVKEALTVREDDGWIEWSGVGCPVADNAIVEIRTMDGLTETFEAAGFAWDAEGGCKITAYRIAKAAS